MFVGEAPGASEDEQGLPSSAAPAGCWTSCSRRSRSSGPRCGSATCSSAVRPATATPSRSRSRTARSTCLRQVELIEPTVICTLGNFSTKLLRGDPTGITRLHGQPEVRHARARGRCGCTRSTTLPPRCTRRGCCRRCGKTSPAIPELLALGPPEQPAPEAITEPPEDADAGPRPARERIVPPPGAESAAGPGCRGARGPRGRAAGPVLEPRAASRPRPGPVWTQFRSSCSPRITRICRTFRGRDEFGCPAGPKVECRDCR